MNENLYKAEYVVTKSNKLNNFYKKNKNYIFISIIIFISLIGAVIFYLESKNEKKILLADNYIEAKIFIKKDEKSKAKNILRTIVYADDSTYSALSLFTILNENLIDNKKDLSNMFDHVLKHNKFDKEIKNLIIFKKSLFESDFVKQKVLIKNLNPLIEGDSLWKPHALFLLGDYFFVKKELDEAKKYYLQILSLKNLDTDLYEQASMQLAYIANE